jgi:hypothetical protein
VKRRGSCIGTIKKKANLIVRNSHFTPERIRRLASEVIPKLTSPTESQLSECIADSLANPTKGMAVSFSKLKKCHQWLLYSLVEQDIATDFFLSAATDADENLERRYVRLCPISDREPFKSVVSEMTEAFVKRRRLWTGNVGIDWIHPSCRDLAIEKLAEDAASRQHFLRQCNTDGLRLAVSLGGGSTGERSFPLLQDDLDWEMVSARLLSAAQSSDKVVDLISSTLQTSENVELDASVLQRFKTKIAVPVLTAIVGEPNRLRNLSLSDLENAALGCAHCGVTVPFDALLERYKEEIDSLPRPDELDEETRYWDTYQIEQLQDLHAALLKYPGLSAHPRFKPLSDRAATKICSLTRFWVENQLNVLSPESPDYADARRGCTSLEKIISKLVPQIESTGLRDRLQQDLTTVRQTGERMHAEQNDEDDDAPPDDTDDEEVSVGRVFEDL